MHFISFPKIGQFNSTVQQIASEERFLGLDDKGDPMYDATKILPKITFKGTVKLHGTNSAVVVHNEEYWVQSRENIITPVKDNCGCAAHFYGTEKQTSIKNIVSKLREKYSIPVERIVVLFGEWVGPNVQKNVAISKLPQKSFFLFAIRVVSPERVITGDNQEGTYAEDRWLPIEGINDPTINVYNITDYQKYSVEIDLNDPSHIVSNLQALVDSVEKECPVSKAFGISGLGEGIVWETEWKGIRRIFKTKGKEHAVTVHKDGKTVHADTEKIKNIQEFAKYSVTESRLNQGLEKVFGQTAPSKEKIGDFIKWIVNDIVTEEIDAISKNGLSVKDVQGEICKASKEWLLKKIGI